MTKSTTNLRTITFEIPEAKAALIEKRYRGKGDINEIAREVLLNFLISKSRTSLSNKELAVAWPPDWYERMLRDYSDGIAGHVRWLIYQAIKDNLLNPVPEPDDERESYIQPAQRKVDPSKNRMSITKQVIIPYSYYDVMVFEHGEGWVSTYVKSLVYQDLKKRAKLDDPELSIPRRLGRFL